MCLSGVYLMLLNVTAHGLPVLPPPYLILEVIKDWRWRRSGNEATIMLCEVHTVCMHVPYLYIIFYLLQMLKAIPLKERVFRTTHKHPKSLVTSSLHRPEKYKLWSEEQMQELKLSTGDGV